MDGQWQGWHSLGPVGWFGRAKRFMSRVGHACMDGFSGRRVVFGEESRVRAVWRVAYGVPMVLIPGLVVASVLGSVGVSGMLPAGLIQASVFLVLLVVFARVLDRRPLGDYGVSATGAWVGRVCLGFLAIVAGHLVWYGVGDMVGWGDVNVVLAAPAGESILVGLATVLVAVFLNVWVQETAYFAVVARSVADGARARGVVARHAVLVGLVGGVVFMWLIHEGSFQRPELLVAGLVYGALYVQSGDLGLSIGAHAGVNVSGSILFVDGGTTEMAVVEVVMSPQGPVLQWLGTARIPQMLVAYAVLVAGLWWWRGDAGVVEGLAVWRDTRS